jgi:hypothetical protein
VGAKVGLEPGLGMGEIAGAINEVERRVRHEIGVDTVIYVEPDLYDATGTNA